MKGGSEPLGRLRDWARDGGSHTNRGLGGTAGVESRRISSFPEEGSVDLCWGRGMSRRPSLTPASGSFRPMQEVPEPTKYFVTRWSTDPWIQMAYSFVKTGGSGEAYDILAEEVQGTVFFAGEVRAVVLDPLTVLVTFF